MEGAVLITADRKHQQKTEMSIGSVVLLDRFRELI